MRTKFIAFTNKDPVFYRIDDAIWRRIVMIPFYTKFCPNSSHRNSEERKSDPGLTHKLTDIRYAQAFIKFLINYRIRSTGDHIEPTENIKRRTEEIMRNNRQFSLFQKIYKN